MPLFRGSKNATIVNGDIVATQADIAEAVNEALAFKNAAETAETGAQTAESGAVDAQSYAEEWAIKPEDILVSSDAGGNGVDEYSALHHASKSSASASAAATSESNAYASQTAAANSASAAATSEANAAQSATNAATSESNAATSASEALTSEQNAATSESNAAASETAAATSETNAANSATAAQSAEARAEDAESYAKEWANAPEDTLISSAAGGDGVDDYSSLHHANKSSASASAAATSESNAASSASAAATSENNAAASELNAATSASNAATSETNAANSASAAATSETNAGLSETAASNSASAALTSENNAATSESNAASSASAASISESNAASSASSAATSATNASNSASAAATSESNAQTSAQNAAASFDSLDARYLGAKSSEPTTDNDGNPLITGALYYNTTDDQLKVWNGSAWDNAAFSADGAVTSFNGRDGSVTLQSSDVTGALGYTPQDEATAYDSTDFSADFGAETTDSLSEGTSNLYYTDTRARNSLSASGDITYDSATGTFSFTERTDSEVRGLFSASGDLSYDAATGVFSVTTYKSTDFDTDFSSKSTDNLSEGISNLYYTDARVDAHLSGGSAINYSSGTISHANTSSQSSVNNSGGTVIQDVTLDGAGHVTGLNSTDLDSRFARVDTTSTQLFIGNVETTANFVLPTGQNIFFDIDDNSSTFMGAPGPDTLDIKWRNDVNYLWRFQSDRNVVLQDNGTTIFSTNTGLSDGRHKENVSNLSGGLETVNELRPVNFTWKKDSCEYDGGKNHVGFIAQEVLPLVPDAVKDFGNYILHKEDLVPHLVAAVQELSKEVEELKEQIKDGN